MHFWHTHFMACCHSRGSKSEKKRKPGKRCVRRLMAKTPAKEEARSHTEVAAAITHAVGKTFLLLCPLSLHSALYNSEKVCPPVGAR